MNCIGYFDANWARDKADRKSTSGYCFKFSSSIISWRSSIQNCVAFSTAEAEYVELTSTVQGAINEDNQSAIYIAKDSGNHAKIKHISIKYYIIRDRTAY